MRNIALAALIIALFVLSPAVGALAAFLLLARRHLAVYINLWTRLLKCDLYTPFITSLGFIITAASPYTGLSKTLLIALAFFSLYLTPLMPRAARAFSIITAGLSVAAPAKPLVVLGAVGLAYFAYKASGCGYVCLKSSALPKGELAYLPELGVTCAFIKGGVDVGRAWLVIGSKYARCIYALCYSVDAATFKRGIGDVTKYLPEPSAEDLRGPIYTVASLEEALKVVKKYFQTVVILSDEVIVARPARLISVAKVKPDIAAEVFAKIYGLTAEQRALAEELLRRRSREELIMWSQRYPWLKPLLELWEGGEEPVGVVKSSAPGKAAVVDSLLYAYTVGAPLLTNNENAFRLAAELGVTALLITNKARGNFIAIGPAAVTLQEGAIEVGAGRFIFYKGGALFGGEI
ncbi:hypothetical protein [Pyrobaculum aerophilum]|uniref:hypothetical protein n=1 Tax=Pyrobaculum aerophilum TaxID=13773 RepID=UPI002FD8B939